ncbi:MAG: hypothetical protein K2H75_04825, partial [Muribaculaceae bacterium]|nr:hypothetical protein [Muribaculaceae bacterium]
KLDLSECTALKTLICSANPDLSVLVIPDSPLVTFSAHTTNIGNVDLSKVAPTLDLVNLNKAGITHLDLTGARQLTWLECSDNPLSGAPVLTGCKNLESVRMENITNQLGDMDFTDCDNLNMLRLDFSRVGTAIDLTKCKKLYELSLQGCGLSEIELGGLINLGYVNVSDNNFHRLDISEADGIWQFWALRNVTPGAQVKVWEDFDISAAEQNQFYVDDNTTLVYEFTN